MTDGTDRVQALRPRPTRPIQVDAVLFDLDGVVTRTAQVHAAAWKRAFDEWFDLRARADGVERQRFDQDRDYRLFVDGRPRHDGVRGFLRSRGIDLPHGTEADDADQDTVCGIAARKNRYFRDWLAHHRVESLPGTLALLGELRQAGVKAGVFSASRNARAVLASAGVTERFDVVVDGHDAVDRGLAGKPDPAVLLEAAARLGVSPDRTAVVEDAVAGIVAGVRGGFGLVIGVDRSGGNGGLREAGADIVVADSSEVTLMPNEGLAVKTLDALPLVWSRQDEIRQRLSARSVALFVDYDGTLTPIVEDFTKAFLATDMRAALEEASRRCTVAVVSGRDIHLLRSLVRLESVYYAGSHGFEIAGPAGWTGRVEKGVECLPALDRAERALA
ncbi:MAG: HAD-IA family hydrolase, partial [Acidobacteriota bacterium]|nr:HAD-IA family hydrolase [Acidobacteriota bacterium]